MTGRYTFACPLLGESRVAQDPAGDAEQRVADLVHQIRERLLVALPGPLDQLSIHAAPEQSPRYG